MKNYFVPLIFLLLAFPHIGSSQDSLTNELTYEVNKIYPPFSITKEKLKEAQAIVDLNSHYKSSWIREFVTVEILAINKGKARQAVGKDDTLTQEQKDIINMADSGTDISVLVQYIPENNLTYNDIKEIKFTFTVDPDSDAEYPGGKEEFNKYLKEKVIDKIPDAHFGQYQLAAVKFTIDEEGCVMDPHVFWSSEDDKIDALLLKAICNMPTWKPAVYSDGVKVKQEFAFTVGDMNSCVVPMLGIRKLPGH